MDRQIVHLDMDAFFVSCTLLKMPKLVGKPLIIGGTSNRGVVASASYEARKYGVQAAMPTRLALQRCPEAIVLKGDFDLYTAYSNIVNEIIAESAPVHERASIDEYYLDMSGMDRFFGSLQFTNELASKIKHETGLPLSFGLSINKTVAKMCTNYAKPTGSFHVTNNEVQPFLDPQSIKNIPALGDVSYKLLRRISIKIIETLRQVPANSMQELLGKNGLVLLKKAKGIDQTPIVPYSTKKSISTESTFDKDTQDIKELKALLLSMVEKLGFQLRDTSLMCSVVSVKIRYSNRDTESAQKRIGFTTSDDILVNYAYELFDKLYQRRMLIRLIGLKFSGLVNGNHQIDLFNDSIKNIKLYEAMDRMKNRFKDPLLIRRANGFSSFDKS